jgi:hypothetical protein
MLSKLDDPSPEPRGGSAVAAEAPEAEVERWRQRRESTQVRATSHARRNDNTWCSSASGSALRRSAGAATSAAQVSPTEHSLDFFRGHIVEHLVCRPCVLATSSRRVRRQRRVSRKFVGKVGFATAMRSNEGGEEWIEVTESVRWNNCGEFLPPSRFQGLFSYKIKI